MYEPFQHLSSSFPSKVPPLRILTPWSQRSRWTTPWRWPVWLLASSCSSSFSWVSCSPSKGGECLVLPCRLLTPAGPIMPCGQVLALLITSEQGSSSVSVQVLKYLNQLWLIVLASERCVLPAWQVAQRQSVSYRTSDPSYGWATFVRHGAPCHKSSQS